MQLESIKTRFLFISDMATLPTPSSMSRAKEWTPEAEEAWRFQVAGYRDELDYKNVKQNEVKHISIDDS